MVIKNISETKRLNLVSFFFVGQTASFRFQVLGNPFPSLRLRYFLAVRVRGRVVEYLARNCHHLKAKWKPLGPLG